MNLEHIRQRYLDLYTGAIADTLDRRGIRDRVLPAAIQAVTKVNRVAGFAFTGRGRSTEDVANNDMQRRLDMLASVTPGSVSVWECGPPVGCAHWGEIMSAAARQKGGVGAVLDGGVRDIGFVDRMEFPVFAAFRNAASSIGRWEILEWQIPLRIGNTDICPGDFVFGDADGIVVVPAALVVSVLEEAEEVFAKERAMKDEIQQGVTVQAAFDKYRVL